MSENNEHKYDEIINLPHHQSATHLHMSMYDRAAQFAPFAALTGHDAAIKETARLTDERIALDENEICLLDAQLRWVQERITSQPEISIVYFQPDKRKAGGSYLVFSGNVKKIDQNDQSVIFTDGTRIAIAEIIEIQTNEGIVEYE